MDRTDTEGGRGGGLLVYGRSGIKILPVDKVVDFQQYCKFKICDVTFYLVYRSPSSGPDSYVKLEDLIRSSDKNSVFFGDFNLPEIDWEMGRARGRAKQLHEAMEDMMMEQMVRFSTHIKGNVLDLVLTNIPERIDEVSEAGRLGKSDHVMIHTKIYVGAGTEPVKARQKDWRRANWTDMKAELDLVDWRTELDNKDGEGGWNCLKAKIQKLVDKYVPERRKRNQNRPVWMNKEILRAIRKKKRLWAFAKQGEKVAEYKTIEKQTKNLIQNAKRKFEKKLADGNNRQNGRRQFFAYVKSRTKSRPSIGPLKDAMGEVVNGDKESADILNSFFSSVFTREDQENIPEPEQMVFEKQLNGVNITTKKVKEKIKKLRTDAASGPDQIGPVLLQELIDQLASPIATVMRKSIESGSVPADWRTAHVAPIFKKGAKSSPGNYRPVSLTSVCCKMLEAIIKDDIVAHLYKNSLIRPTQHGFMRGKSCATNLLSFFEAATTAVDAGQPVDVVYLDFAKAFDKVPVKRLMKKVKAHGIGGHLYRWIEAWLSNRRQRVVLNGQSSNWADVLSGVPQGSVLGPLLFIIFINDLDTSASGVDILLKFADDTKIGQVLRQEEDREALQAAIDGLVEWTIKWGMEFNVQKCKIMHLGHNNKKLEYTMGEVRLDSTVEEKDLGILVSAKLKPGAHCAKAARTARAVLGQITRAFHFRDKYVFIQLYKQYVRPHLEFSVQAWSPWQQGDIDTLEAVQKKAVAMVSGLKGRAYEERLVELGMTTLEERRHQADMALVYSIMTGKVDVDSATWFSPATDSGRATRVTADPLNVRVKHGRLDTRRNFFSVRVSEPWNKIPTECKQQKTVAGFKSAYARIRSSL